MNNTNVTPPDIYIYTRQGLQLTEKACIAYESNTHKIKGVGNEAWAYTGQNDNIIVGNPLQEGRIVNFFEAEKMFYHIIRRVDRKHRFLRIKHAAVVVEDDLNEIDQTVFEQALAAAGIIQVTVLPASEYQTETDYLLLTEKYEMILVISPKETDKAIIEKFHKIIALAQKKGISASQLEQLWAQAREGFSQP